MAIQQAVAMALYHQNQPCCPASAAPKTLFFQFASKTLPILHPSSAGTSRLRIRCAGESAGFFGRLGRVIKEKAKSDIERLFSGVSKTRENLAVVDELLTYWNLSDTEDVLEQLEEALLVADFGPRTAAKIIDALRKDILSGKLKSGPEIKVALKLKILSLLTGRVTNTELQLGSSRPAVIMIVGVNGGGKTTTLGKLAYRFKKDNVKVLMAAGDTFRAAAGEQLEVWAERTGSEICMAGGEKARPASVLSQAMRQAVDEKFDIVLADTSGRLHTNYNLMEELRGCKRAITKVISSAPNVRLNGAAMFIGKVGLTVAALVFIMLIIP